MKFILMLHIFLNSIFTSFKVPFILRNHLRCIFQTYFKFIFIFLFERKYQSRIYMRLLSKFQFKTKNSIISHVFYMCTYYICSLYIQNRIQLKCFHNFGSRVAHKLSTYSDSIYYRIRNPYFLNYHFILWIYCICPVASQKFEATNILKNIGWSRWSLYVNEI